ncbi:MAG: helicase, partial [Pseudomonadota bacterium]
RIAPAEKDPETGAVKLWRFQSKAHLEAQEQRRAARKQSRPKPESKGPRKRHVKAQNKRHSAGGGRGRPSRREPDPDSPFAVLGALLPDKPKPSPKPKKKKPKKAQADTAGPQADQDTVAKAPDETPPSAPPSNE